VTLGRDAAGAANKKCFKPVSGFLPNDELPINNIKCPDFENDKITFYLGAKTVRALTFLDLSNN
jgi:hypothetical protein